MPLPKSCICAALLLTIFASTSALADDKMVRIIDGDTIEIDGRRMRIFGIDAPETHQSCQDINQKDYQCGVSAKETLRDIVGLTEFSGTVPSIDCTGIDKDRYGRWVSVCFINQVNIGREMVRRGAAVAYRQYSMEYVTDEEIAKTAKIGVWQGTFDLPWVWRRNQKQPQ